MERHDGDDVTKAAIETEQETEQKFTSMHSKGHGL